MAIRAQDVVPISEARARLTELAEKVLTKNGAAFVAIVDAKKLDYYHELERRERGRMLMLSDAERGIQDVLAGRVLSAEDFRKSLQDRAEKRRVKNQA